MSLEEIYQEVILDHYKNPRGKKGVACPSGLCSLHNPLCGDQVCMAIKVEEQPIEIGQRKIVDVSSTGHGCSISQAAGSMVCELCKGRSIEEIEGLCEGFRRMMRGEVSGEEVPSLGDAVALQGVRKFSARVKCAMLAWEALENCLKAVKSGECPKSN